jgi:hypothetical protein
MRFHREEVWVRKKGSRERSRAPYVQHRQSYSHKAGSIAELSFPQIFTLACVQTIVDDVCEQSAISAIESEVRTVDRAVRAYSRVMPSGI